MYKNAAPECGQEPNGPHLILILCLHYIEKVLRCYEIHIGYFPLKTNNLAQLIYRIGFTTHRF